MVAGPLTLEHGEPGIVVRVPIFQRGRDGRDYFWGLVAVSMQLPGALARARINGLPAQGYDYALLASAAGARKPAAIATHGALPLQDTVQQPVRARNLEFRLALRPRAGWVSPMKVALECLGVMAVCGLLWVMVRRWEDLQPASEAAGGTLSPRPRGGEKEDREAAQGKLRFAEEKVRLQEAARTANVAKQVTQAKLKEAQSRADELQTRMESAVRATAEAAQARQAEIQEAQEAIGRAEQARGELQARLEADLDAERKAAAATRAELKEAQSRADELQARLESAVRATDEATQARQAEIQEAQEAIGRAEQTRGELQARLEADLDAERKAAAAARAELKEAQSRADELQARLESAVRATAEAVQVRQAEIQEAQEAVGRAKQTHGELQASLEADLDAERKAAAAVRAKLKEARLRADELQTRLQAQQAAMADLESRLEAAHRSQAEAAAASVFRLECSEASNKELQERLVAAAQLEARIVELTALLEAARTPVREVQTDSDTSAAALVAEPAPAIHNETAAADAAPVEAPPADPPAPIETPTPEEAPAPAPAPTETASPAKRVKRRKARPDRQIDLFESQVEPAKDPAPAPPPEPVASMPEPAPEAASEPAADDRDANADLEAADQNAALELPTIEGLATAEGFARAGGDPELYLNALQHFVEQQAGVPDKIQEALLQGDPAAAGRIIQALQSQADEIGAKAAQSAAADLAHAVGEPSDPARIESCWQELDRILRGLVADLKPLSKPEETKSPAPARPPGPVNIARLRKAVNEILPLLVDQDPGSKDCFKANRGVFRSAFSAEAFPEFERLVKESDLAAALEQLRKAAKRHGISV
jgi:HPt (histidine-containing phosphotransfer) domain-containing protein